MIKLNRGHDKNIVLSKEALKEIRGLSAYEIAKQEGFTGTVDEWLASLKGAKGDKGDTFKLSDLTPEELNTIKGPRGETGYTGPQGPPGTAENIDLTPFVKKTENTTLTGQYTFTNNTPIKLNGYNVVSENNRILFKNASNKNVFAFDADTITHNDKSLLTQDKANTLYAPIGDYALRTALNTYATKANLNSYVTTTQYNNDMNSLLTALRNVNN